MMNNIMFFTLAIAGFIFVLVGYIMLKNPPKRINYWYGYRTPASMKNEARWNFAQVYASKELIKIGIILMLLSVISFVYPLSETRSTVAGGVIVFCSAMVMIFRVENGIKDRFEK